MDIAGELRVEISNPSSPKAGDTLDIRVKVSNPGNSSVTVLTWDSPLDPQAGVLGLFELRDSPNGSIQQGKVLMINRLMPPSPDSLVEIPANGSVENTARLKMLSLQSAHSYKVVAKGNWKGVWNRTMNQVDQATLEEFGGAGTGDFTSNEVTVEIP